VKHAYEYFSPDKGKYLYSGEINFKNKQNTIPPQSNVNSNSIQSPQIASRTRNRTRNFNFTAASTGTELRLNPNRTPTNGNTPVIPRSELAI
jgi:hypothetical protein